MLKAVKSRAVFRSDQKSVIQERNSENVNIKSQASPSKNIMEFTTAVYTVTNPHLATPLKIANRLLHYFSLVNTDLGVHIFFSSGFYTDLVIPPALSVYSSRPKHQLQEAEVYEYHSAGS